MTNRAFPKGWRRAALAAALAYALALQALLFALGGVLHAGAADLSQGIFCASGAESGQDHAPANGHDSLCCVLSCHTPAQPAGPAPVVASLDRPSLPSGTRSLSGEAAFLRHSSNVLPVGSRAPPRLG